MKRRTIGVAAAVVTLLSAQASLAATCPDMSPPAITAPAAAGAKCQSALAKFASKFISAKVKQEAKCIMGFDELACPSAAVASKVQGTAQKSLDKIAAACDASALGALTSSYSSGFSGQNAGSCTLSQNNVEAKLMIGISNGPPASWGGAPERGKCAQAVSKAATKYIGVVLKTVNSCVDGQIKAGTAGDLGPICIGSYAGGNFTAPTDAKAAAKIASAISKAEGSIQKACGDNPVATSAIRTLFACEGAETAQDLKNCVVCNNWEHLMNVFTQQYAETGSFVAPGAGALQAAIDAAAAGDKLLIASGTYEEEISIVEAVDGDRDGIQLVGCGGATDERPVIRPGLGAGPNGIFAADVDGLLFQSISPNGWDENGIFVTGADGVTFRDVIADGEEVSLYSIFPVQSTNVVVEASEVTRVSDAGIYVGQAIDCVTRYNYVHGNIAGIEIENSDSCEVYGNLAKGNNAGILVFKLTSPALQISLNHEVSHNVSSANNLDGTFTAPGIIGLVPSGTGYLVISNDFSVFHHNLARGNGSFGFGFLDQLVVNALVGSPVFNPPSVDQKAEGNSIRDNIFADNGGAPDATPPNATPLSGNMILALGDETNHNNCFENNFGGGFLFLTANDCTP
jgi:parallel beta-helix repeat protein